MVFWGRMQLMRYYLPIKQVTRVLGFNRLQIVGRGKLSFHLYQYVMFLGFRGLQNANKGKLYILTLYQSRCFGVCRLKLEMSDFLPYKTVLFVDFEGLYRKNTSAKYAFEDKGPADCRKGETIFFLTRCTYQWFTNIFILMTRCLY